MEDSFNHLKMPSQFWYIRKEVRSHLLYYHARFELDTPSVDDNVNERISHWAISLIYPLFIFIAYLLYGEWINYQEIICVFCTWPFTTWHLRIKFDQFIIITLWPTSSNLNVSMRKKGQRLTIGAYGKKNPVYIFGYCSSKNPENIRKSPKILIKSQKKS